MNVKFVDQTQLLLSPDELRSSHTRITRTPLNAVVRQMMNYIMCACALSRQRRHLVSVWRVADVFDRKQCSRC